MNFWKILVRLRASSTLTPRVSGPTLESATAGTRHLAGNVAALEIGAPGGSASFGFAKQRNLVSRILCRALPSRFRLRRPKPSIGRAYWDRYVAPAVRDHLIFVAAPRGGFAVFDPNRTPARSCSGPHSYSGREALSSLESITTTKP